MEVLWDAVYSSTWRICPSFHPNKIPTRYAELRQWRCGDGSSEETLNMEVGSEWHTGTAVQFIFAVQSKILNPVSSGDEGCSSK